MLDVDFTLAALCTLIGLTNSALFFFFCAEKRRLRQAMEKCEENHRFALDKSLADMRGIRVTPSIGISLYPNDESDADSLAATNFDGL